MSYQDQTYWYEVSQYHGLTHLDRYYLKKFILQKKKLICWPIQSLMTSSNIAWTCYMFPSVMYEAYLLVSRMWSSCNKYSLGFNIFQGGNCLVWITFRQRGVPCVGQKGTQMWKLQTCLRPNCLLWIGDWGSCISSPRSMI